jgi:hypothetical protein
MPIDTITEARDEIYDHFTTAWNAVPAPVPLLLYADKHQDLPADGDYARIMVRHNIFTQSTLGGKPSLGGSGRRFRRSGIVTVQVFTRSNDGLTRADILVQLALDAFEGEDTGSDRIEFINARANEIGQDGPWHQTNVVAEFRYDRIK